MKECPNCKLINPPDAVRCDCGYDFGPERLPPDVATAIRKLRQPNIFLFLLDLPVRFIVALIGFTFAGWIGWAGIILVLLRVFGVIHWPWWVAALPLEYGVIYCLYMTIDGALYRAGLKGVGRYARHTQGLD
jgi:hypothetical protein